LFHLSGERIEMINEVTKLNIHECFTFLCYKQDVAQVNSINKE